MPLPVCIIGASTVEGLGDEDGLGWPGRLKRQARASDLVLYNLGVRGHSSAMIAERWQRECAARIPDPGPGLIVISFGNNDVAELESGATRVPMADTIKISAGVIERCVAWRKTLWVGPTPVDESRMPFHSRLLQLNLYYRNARLAALNAEFSAVAERVGIPYLDLFGPLSSDQNFIQSISGRDGLHPDGNGYEIIATKIATWDAWRAAIQPV